MRRNPFAVRRDDTGNLAVLDDQFRGADTAPQCAAALFQIGGQPPQGHVRAAALPVQPGGAAARRGHDPAHEFELPALDELGAFLADPGQRPRAFLRQQPGMGCRVVHTGLARNGGADVLDILGHVAEGDMDDPAGDARIAEIVGVAALFQYGGLQAQREGAVGRAQPRQPTADNDDIVGHFSFPVLVIAAAACRR